MAATPSDTASASSYHMASAPPREDMELLSGSQGHASVGPAAGRAPDSFQQRELKNDLGCCKLLCPSCLACFLGCLIPCAICPMQINPRQESVMIHYGRYIGTLREPGLYCVNGCGTTATSINTAVSSTDLPNLKVLDSKGNPLRVSGVVMWEVLDSKVAVLDVQQYANFLRSQSEVVMKQICSKHPYDELKVETGKIAVDIVHLLQNKVSQAGLRVLDMNFNEISYAPEIASQMLVRQQAEAMLDARKVVVDGSVTIAHDAIVQLRERGIVMAPAETARLASNLIITICSESRVQPTMSLSAPDDK